MPSESPGQRFADIVREIDLIHEFVGSMDYEAFARDPKTVHAVERAFQIISEAAVKLGTEAESRCPDIPWVDIRRLGNHLRHAYDTVSTRLMWDSITTELEPLRQACLPHAED